MAEFYSLELLTKKNQLAQLRHNYDSLGRKQERKVRIAIKNK